MKDNNHIGLTIRWSGDNFDSLKDLLAKTFHKESNAV